MEDEILKNMGEILLIKCSEHIEILTSDIEIVEVGEYGVDYDCIHGCIEELDNCIIKISDIEIYSDSGQEGDFGRYEIQPHQYIDTCKVEKSFDIYDYKTKEEIKIKKAKTALKRATDLQEYVSSLSTDTTQYYLQKTWACSSLEFGTRSGELFKYYTPIHSFKNDKQSKNNIKKIKNWIDGYLKNQKDNKGEN